MKRIYLAVYNDLTFDQRMKRICTTLSLHFDVVLVGKETKHMPPLIPELNYTQYRIRCRFSNGKRSYIEFNIRLFFFLLFKRMDALCAIDLDTILPCYFISKWRNIPRVYDAHELFTEMKEVVTRPLVRKIWRAVERYCVPRFPNGYTVSDSIASEFLRRYGVNYTVIRNLPLERNNGGPSVSRNKLIIYQGAINEARGLEALIPAMKQVDAELHIYGRGNFEQMLFLLINRYKVKDKVHVHAPVNPTVLKTITDHAYIGINLVENTGLNQFYSLANKFFDYMHSGVPQVTMRYPEYQAVNANYEIAVLIDDLDPNRVAEAINSLLNNPALYTRLHKNCLDAKKFYNWQQEERKLIDFYNKLLL